MLEKIKRLLAKTENSKSIEAALAEIDIPSLQKDLADAATKRTSLLLTGTDPQLLAAEKAIESARLALDRAEAAQAELQTRFVAAQKAEAKAEFDRQYAEAAAARDAAIVRIENDYAAASRLISGVLAEVEAADQLVSAVNAQLRKGWFDEQHPAHDGVALNSVSAEHYSGLFLDVRDIRATTMLPTLSTSAIGAAATWERAAKGKWA